MADRSELLEAALDCFPEGIVFFGAEDEVILWNQVAQSITGYSANEMLTQSLPEGMKPLLQAESSNHQPRPSADLQRERRALVRMRHKLGHEFAVLTRIVDLSNTLGQRIGCAAIFHPAESLDALPYRECSEESGVEESRAELEERLQIEFDDFARGGPPCCVLLIAVDQAKELRKTHGVAASQSMLEKVRRALSQGLRPAEEIGRWADDEFLVVARERSAEMLAAHAQTLVGLARTADFRWWGDRVSLSVSIGAVQALNDASESLAQLLERARAAMETSSCSGGNRVTAASCSSLRAPAVEDAACLP